MAQDNPAQGLIDLYDRATGKKKPPPPEKKADTSWHDEQVRKANASFANEKVQVGKKPAPKATKKRSGPLANKRTSRKKG